MDGTRSCPLCERRALAREAHFAYLESVEDDDQERVDYVALKRMLEERLERDLTISGVKRHFTDHVVYEYKTLHPVADDDPNYGLARPCSSTRVCYQRASSCRRQLTPTDCLLARQRAAPDSVLRVVGKHH